MNKFTSPWTEYIMERASSGPVRYSELITEAAALVPPGRGYRLSIDSAASSRRLSGSGERHYVDEEHRKDMRVRYGQRSIVASTIHKLAQRQRIEDYEQDGVRMIRKGRYNLNEVPFQPDRLTPWAKTMLRQVRDGPVLLNDALVAAYADVPVERAIQRARSNRERVSHARGHQWHGPKDDETDFLVGARQIVQSTLKGHVERQRFVVLGTGKDAIVSKGPRWHDPDLAG